MGRNFLSSLWAFLRPRKASTPDVAPSTLVRATPLEASGLDAQSLVDSANEAWQQGEYLEASELASRALAAGEAAHAPAELLVTAGVIGGTALGRCNRFREALDLLERVGVHANRVQDADCLFQYHMNRGVVLKDAGQDAAALVEYRRAERVSEGVAVVMRGVLEVNIGTMMNAMGRNEEALTAYGRAMSMIEDRLKPGVLMNTGNALRALGRLEEAMTAYGEALEKLDRGDSRLMGQVLSNLATTTAELGRSEESLPIFERALAARRQGGDLPGQAYTLNELARQLHSLQQFARALEAAREGEVILARLGHPDLILLQATRQMIEESRTVLDDVDQYLTTVTTRLLTARSVSDFSSVLQAYPTFTWQPVATHLSSLISPDTPPHIVQALTQRRDFVLRCCAVGPEAAVAEMRAAEARLRELQQTMIRIMEASDWLSSKRVTEAKFVALTGPEGKRALEVLLGSNASNKAAVARIKALIELLKACSEDGIDLAFARVLPNDLEAVLQAFLQSGRWGESRVLVHCHRGLLVSEAAIALIQELLGDPSRTADELARLELHRVLLERCRSIGVDPAFDEMEASTANQGGLKSVTYTRAIPDFRAVPAEGRPASESLDQNVRSVLEMVRSMEAVGVAPLLLAGLRNKLGVAYLDTSEGSEAENLREAFACFEQALNQTSRELHPQTYSRIANNLALTLTRYARLQDPPNDSAVLRAAEYYRIALGIQRPPFMPMECRTTAQNLYELTLGFPGVLGADADALALEACSAAMDAVDILALWGDAEAYRDEVERSLWAYSGAVVGHFFARQFGGSLEAAERGKARGFLNDVSTAERDILSTIPSELAEREREARAALKTAQQSDGQTMASEGAIASARAELEDVYRTMAGIAPEYTEVRRARPPSLSAMLQLALEQAPGSLFLEWCVLDAGTLLMVLEGGTGDVSGFEVPLTAQALRDHLAIAERDFWQPPDEEDSPLSPAWLALAEKLFPDALTEALRRASSVTLVPHRTLHALPLHALPIPWLGHEPLLASKPVRYLPSLAVGRRLLHRENRGTESALVMAYAGGHAQRDDVSFDDEATAVAGFLEAAAHVGLEANRSLLIEASARARVVHIACHAAYEPSDPMASGLLLAPAPGGNGGNVFTARQALRELSLPGSLVTLSGCETGRASDTVGDELDGFVRALLVAGASQVVASAWRVDSPTTQGLMIELYRRYCRGERAVDSLQRASMAVRARRETSHPYYWAPFVVYGL